MLHHFPQFPRLPVEIRCCIWKLALQQPRVHRLRIGRGKEDLSFVLHATETLPRSTITARNILATCMESRFEAKRALPDFLPLANGFTLRFNKHNDVICLAKLEVDIVEAVLALLDARRQSSDADQWLEQLGQVHSLAIELRNTGFIYNKRIPSNELDRLPLLLAAFKGLEWFFLVPRPSPDDPTTLRCDRDQAEAGYGEHEDEQENEDGWIIESQNVEYTMVGSNAQLEGGEISTDDNVFPVGYDNNQPVCGDWLRGENGLSDWYRWVPDYAIWNFATKAVHAHFDETVWQIGKLNDKLREVTHLSDLTGDEKQRLGSVRMEVMVHFREGVEPVYDL